MFSGALLEMSILITLKSSNENEGLKIAGWFFFFSLFVFLSWMLFCIVLSRGFYVALIEDGSVLNCFRMIIGKTHLRTAVDTFVLQTDILMMQY